MCRADSFTTSNVPIVLKSWSINLLEPSGPVQACNGIALPLLGVYSTERISCPIRQVAERNRSLALGQNIGRRYWGEDTEDNDLCPSDRAS